MAPLSMYCIFIHNSGPVAYPSPSSSPDRSPFLNCKYCFKMLRNILNKTLVKIIQLGKTLEFNMGKAMWWNSFAK